MSNKRKICNLGIKKHEYLTNSIQEVTTKAPEGFELRMPHTLSTQLWRKLHSVVNKIRLIKQNVVSIRGQPCFL